MEKKQTENRRMDCHLHSLKSDGTCTPEEVIRLAALEGAALAALSDHDTADGVPEALAAADTYGCRVLPAVEMAAEFPEQLHILGLGIDWKNERLSTAIGLLKQRRTERNAEITEKLLTMGMDIRPWLQDASEVNVMTRTHLAAALLKGGFVQSVAEAFQRYIGNGRPAYVPATRYSPEEIVEMLTAAGGYAVIAHPCHLKRPVATIAERLKETGLWGIEAYYPSATEGQICEHRTVAHTLGLAVTCGSDFHGANRPGIDPCCSWRDVPELRDSFLLLWEKAAAAVSSCEENGTMKTGEEK